MRELLRQDARSAASGAAREIAEQRNAPRFTVLIRAAKLISKEGEFLCVIRDVSESGISVRIFHPLPDSGTMQVELQNGEQYDVKLIWQDDERAGFRFAGAADVARIIELPSRFAKRSIRLNLDAKAELVGGLQILPATIEDISQQGAKVAVQQMLYIDQRVKLRANGLRETEAKVRWRRDGMCGLIFEETFQFGELARIVRTLQGFDQ